MLDANGALDAGKRDIEAVGGELDVDGRSVDFGLRVFDRSFGASLQFIYAAADLALCRDWARLSAKCR